MGMMMHWHRGCAGNTCSVMGCMILHRSSHSEQGYVVVRIP